MNMDFKADLRKAIRSISDRRRSIGLYALVFLVVVVVGTLVIDPFAIPGDAITKLPTDPRWAEATIASFGQSGPLGANPHLSWPGGYNEWTFPQMGLFISTLAWLVSTVANGPGAALVWTLIVILGVNALCCLFLIRSITKDRLVWFCAAAAAAIGAAPGVLQPGHINVTTWFALPLILGVTLRANHHGKKVLIIAGILITFAALISPLWWLIVTGLIAAILFASTVLRARWRQLQVVSIALVGLGIGLVGQYSLIKLGGGLSETVHRGPWNSNIYSGYLTDFLLGSPLAQHFAPSLQHLRPGAARELNQVGLIPSIAGLFLVLLLVSGLPRRLRSLGPQRLGLLGELSAISILLFLTGGFGNLQAALVVLAHSASPARVWQRVGLLVALLGFVWLAILLNAWLERRALSGAKPNPTTLQSALAGRWVQIGIPALATAVVLTTWVGDFHYTKRNSDFVAASTFPANAPVRYLEAATDPCPVLQLPINDGNPPPFQADGMGLKGLTGYTPYLIAPDYFWTYGGVTPNPALEGPAVPTALEQGQAALAQKGYCAVLFDTTLADAAAKAGKTLPASNVSALGTPDFQNEQYQLWILPRTS